MQRASVSVDVLCSTELFAELAPRDHEALATCLRARSYAPGEAVFREGDPGGVLFIVAAGGPSCPLAATGSGEPSALRC